MEELYNERYRPQFHFTAKRNWLNDPNGLMYYKGEYHLFFQHNPTGINWGNMTWGHAISEDLVHWNQIENALYPDNLGTIFSGSGVVDWNDTAGFQTGEEKPLICIYTSAGGTSDESKGQPFTQSIAYSNDRGRTWTKYDKNPVLGHIIGSNRDPKVVWHNPTEKWIMVLYLDGNDYALFSSPNLKKWTHLSNITLPNTSECPDIFELSVDGDLDSKKWVFWGANGNHYIGTFDGKIFKPESELLRADFGANFYAGQTWSDIPESDGRRIQIAWMSGGKYPGMPFNQQMTFPVELTLRTTFNGIRLFRKPIMEIENIHQKGYSWEDQVLTPKNDILSGIEGELLDIYAEIDLHRADGVEFVIYGEKIQYNKESKQLSCLGRSAFLEPIDDKISLQILVDRTSIEVFGNDGYVSLSSCYLRDFENKNIFIYPTNGEANIVSLKIYELKSAWI